MSDLPVTPSDSTAETERQKRMLAIVDALAEPTRGRIFLFLEFKGEMTASQLATLLGLHVNTVSHHLRLLRQLGILSEPRTVIHKNYIEKYYHVDKHYYLREYLRQNPHSLDEAMRELPPQRHQEIFVTLVSAAATFLEQEARHLSSLTPTQFREVLGSGGLLTSISLVPKLASGAVMQDLRSSIRTKISPLDQLESGIDGLLVMITSFPLGLFNVDEDIS